MGSSEERSNELDDNVESYICINSMNDYEHRGEERSDERGLVCAS